MKEVFIFRHGETDWNKEGRMQGHADVPLNETGRAQALVLQSYFAKHPVEVFLCSDLGRAMETAEIARGTLNAAFVIDPRQRETHLGDAEGLTRSELSSIIDADAWGQWASFPDFLERTPYTKIGFSSHGGSMRRLLHSLRPDVTAPIHVGNCFLYKLNFDSQRGLWIENINPLTHAEN